MKLRNLNIKYLVLLLICTVTISVFTSCSEDDEGEYKLTGDITSLIPEYSYSIDSKVASGSDGTNYLYVAPKLDDNFEYWGLKLSNVDYYIDNVLTKSANESPFDLVCPVTEIGIGSHSLTAKMTISGTDCEAVVEKSDEFVISSTGILSDKYAEFYMDYNHVEKDGTLHITPHILTDLSPEGTEITEVEYYWDDELIETKTSSPFTWDYQVNEDAGTEHKIHANIQYKDNNNLYKHYSWSFSGYRVMKSDDCFYWWQTKSANTEYENGETVQSIAKVYKGKDNKDTHTFKLYYDDTLIGESSTFPYEIDYKLENQSVGSHTFMYKWTVKKTDGTSYGHGSYKTITVLK